MKRGGALALAALLAGSAVVLLGAADANAACRQVFTNTTCSGIWPWQKCVNHFKQVCDSPASSSLIKPGARPVLNTNPNLAGRPATANKLITNDGGSLIGHDGGSFRRP